MKDLECGLNRTVVFRQLDCGTAVEIEFINRIVGGDGPRQFEPTFL
ncbi:MAG: hypothetical protein P8Y40_13015 [Desulfobacterales bacterium]